MKIFTIALGILAVVCVAGYLAYRFLLPRAFVAAGRGVVNDPQVVSVNHVITAATTPDFDGVPVSAGPGYKYVVIDCTINAPGGQIDFDDFQLVKSRAATLGSEENVGDNADRHYFYWSFLDDSGERLSEVPSTQSPVRARIAFKVPTEATTGFLFYWGFYWGPLQFGR